MHDDRSCCCPFSSIYRNTDKKVDRKFMENVIIVLLSCILCFTIIRGVRGKICKFIIYTYCGYWLISLFSSTFNPYGLFEIKTSTYTLLCLNVIAFSLGFCLCKNKKNRNQKIDIKENLLYAISHIENNVLFVLLFLVSLLICSILFVISQMVSSIDGTGELRWNLNEVLFGGNEFLHIYFSLILGPIFQICNILLGLNLFAKEKRSMIRILLYVVFSFMYASISGGRLLYVVIFLEIIFVYIAINSQNKLFQKKYIIPFCVASIVLYSLLCFTTARKRENVDFSWDIVSEEADGINRSLVTYSTAPFRLFDYALENDYLGKAGGYKYGRSTFQSLDDITNSLCGILKIDYTPVFPSTTKFLGEELIVVSDQLHPYNYAYTSLMMHYYDFGIIGCIAFPFFFGFFLRKMVFRFEKRANLANLCIIAYLYYGAIYSIFTWFLVQMYSAIYIIIMFYFSKKIH